MRPPRALPTTAGLCEEPKTTAHAIRSAKRSRDSSLGCQAQERILLMSSAEGALDFEGASRPGEIFRSVGRPDDHFQHHETMHDVHRAFSAPCLYVTVPGPDSPG